MRKILSICIAAIIAVCFSGISVHAHDYGTVNVGIGVEIVLGGTAVITPDDSSPAPDKTEITLKNGETGNFNIAFSSIGIYDYTVRTVPDKRNLKYDSTVYRVKIFVNDADGTLEPTVIVSKGKDKYADDPDRLLFVNTVPGNIVPSYRPRTEDNSAMTAVFLFGLLAFAVFTAVSAGLIGRFKKNNG